MKDVWHHLSIEEIYKKLNTSEEGLSQKEAQRRLLSFGPNELEAKKKRNNFLIFLEQFKSPLIYVLILAAIITYFLKHTVDTWVILSVVFFNAFFGLLHEKKAEKAMEALSKLMAFKTKVRREGVLLDLPSVELVPGDMVEMTAGMKVPADLRIISERNLEVDEAILTGESVPKDKSPEILDASVPLGDRQNMLYGGTMIISGKALVMVVATGKATEFGKIAQEVLTARETKTPLQLKLAKFSEILLTLVLGTVFVIFLLGVLKGLALLEMFLVALAAAISAIPEGLPAVITVTLANGAFRMAKRQAIVRKLIAVETLGSITAIASDKTGTLTHNQMTVEKIYLYQEARVYRVTGSGYEPKGEILTPPSAQLKDYLKLALLISDAEIFEKNREWGVLGDPTEGAVVVAAAKAGFMREKIIQEYPRLDEIPFETSRGFRAALHQISHDKNILIIQGKIEEILLRANLSEEKKKAVIFEMEKFAKSALRVIALASKEMPQDYREILEKDLAELNFLGFVGMLDPPRKEAIEAIRICQESGIRPLMLTGDYPITAKAVAQELGIIKNDQDGVISGEALAKMSPQELNQILTKYSVYARISPEIKLKIVEGLQKQGQIVAVTGDGINDAPALKKADIGVAMGEGGTDASREVADLVLADNNFATIISAIEEGRTIFQNIRRVVFYLLSTSVGEIFIILSALLLLPVPYNLPLLPVQILWLNLVTDGTAGLSLALEPSHQGVIKFPPRSPKTNILDRIIVTRTILVGSVMLLGTMFLYFLEIKMGAGIDRARTIAFTTMVVFQVLNVLNSRSLKESIFKLPFFSNKYVLGSMVLSFFLSYLTVDLLVMRSLFHTTPLSLFDWLKIILISFSILVAVEIEKLIRRRTNAHY